MYLCTGSEANAATDFFITLPAARDSDAYFVTASLAGVASIFAFDLPNKDVGDRTTQQFRIITSAPVQFNDRIEFRIYDPSPPSTVTQGEVLAIAHGSAMP